MHDSDIVNFAMAVMFLGGLIVGGALGYLITIQL